MKKTFLGIVKILDKFEEIVGITTLAAMIIIMIMQIFFRYCLNMPLTWTEEAARYLSIWITFIGAGYGVKHHYHISMEALVNLFPEGIQRMIQVFVNLICIVSFAYLVPYGFKFMVSQHTMDSVAMQIPMSYIAAAVPLGLTMVVIRLTIDTIKVLMKQTITKEQVFVE